MLTFRATALCLGLLLTCLAGPVLAKKWTDKSGKFSVEAEFLGLLDGVVTLKRADGQTTRIPLDQLNAADQQEAQKLAQSAGAIAGEKNPFAVTDEKPVLPQEAGTTTDDKNTRTVIVEGVGTTAEDAVKHAIRNAVRQVVGEMVDAKTLLKNDEVVKDQVLTHSDVFISKQKKVTEKRDGGLFRVTIQATVQRQNLVTKLKAANITVNALERPIPTTAVQSQPTQEPNGDAGNGDILLTVEKAGQAKAITETRLVGPTGYQTEFRDVLSGGGLLVGLKLSTGKFGKNFRYRAVASLQPVYRTRKGLVEGTTNGPIKSAVTALIAKDGYAVGSLQVHVASGRVQGIRLVFMKISGNQLNPKDSYLSGPYLSVPDNVSVIGGNGQPTIGVRGWWAKQELRSIGLVQATLQPEPPKPPGPTSSDATGVTAASTTSTPRSATPTNADDSNRLVRLADSYFTFGDTAALIGRTDQAIEFYSKAIQSNPRHAKAYASRGALWMGKNENSKAIADLNEALRLNPRDTEVYCCRGSAWSLEHEWENALADCNAALQLDAKSIAAYKLRSMVYRDKGETYKAEEDFKRAESLRQSLKKPTLEPADETSFPRAAGQRADTVPGFSQQQWQEIEARIKSAGWGDAAAFQDALLVMKGAFAHMGIPNPSTRQLFNGIQGLTYGLGKMSPADLALSLRKSIILSRQSGVPLMAKEDAEKLDQERPDLFSR